MCNSIHVGGDSSLVLNVSAHIVILAMYDYMFKVRHIHGLCGKIFGIRSEIHFHIIYMTSVMPLAEVINPFIHTLRSLTIKFFKRML